MSEKTNQGEGGTDDASRNEPVTLTKAELQKLVDENRAEADRAAREQLAAERDREKEEADRLEAEKRGEHQKIAEQEKAKRTEAEQRAAAAERRAQMAEVNVQLRDHLAHEDRRAYLANAPDIMLHVEKSLPPDAKPEDVTKLIEKEASAFIQRTGAKGAGHGATAGASRGKLPPGTTIPPRRTNGATPPRIGTAGSRF